MNIRILKTTLITISVFSVLLCGCTEKKYSKPSIYEGELPCKGCKGVTTMLTLNSDLTYTMSETFHFSGEKDRYAVVKGRWVPLKGFKNDNSAIVYRLLPDNNGDIMYFLMPDAKSIRKLNRNGEIIKSKKNYILRKKA